MGIGAPGILDPCEREKIDASSNLTSQQREDLTFSAQVCQLRENDRANSITTHY